ncbi:PQ loop repeat-domain-containing protein [Phlyctochytrium arcticum]|nr:PQ loop repeat-domain-containing protein [Phlyctochytrium arcticum]
MIVSELIPSLFSTLSLAFWLSAQLPQLYKNYSLKSTTSLSPLFLIIWLAGDTANFLGCLLTNQLPFQTYLAMYFVGVDACLVGQFLWYGWGKPAGSGEEVEIDEEEEWTGASPMLSRNASNASLMSSCQSLSQVGLPTTSAAAIMDEATPLLLPSPPPSSTPLLALSLLTFTFFSTSSSSPLSTPSQVYSEPPISDHPSSNLGPLLAWTCTTLYLSSRLPQILRNAQRKSTEGLSISMFICAALGNLTYVCSIFSRGDWAVVLNALPYLIGSAGTWGFDCLIFAQYLYYGRPRRFETVTLPPPPTDMESGALYTRDPPPGCPPLPPTLSSTHLFSMEDTSPSHPHPLYGSIQTLKSCTAQPPKLKITIPHYYPMP